MFDFGHVVNSKHAKIVCTMFVLLKGNFVSSSNPCRLLSFESQCLSSTEFFCEQLHNRALKPTLSREKRRQTNACSLLPVTV